MLITKDLKNIYRNKKVLITGHTGFKGSYMCVLLNYLGAKVYGYSLKPEKNSLYTLIGKSVVGETFADIRDTKKLTAFMKKVKPDYILHMAAQPLVLRGYEEPAYTYDVNVMGTVSLMEAICSTYSTNRRGEPVSILNVTTDKVYENNDLSNYAFKENDKLCGRDPYANSKSCSELVTYAYKKSFFSDEKYFRVSTARAGNVIGGGDLNKDRIIPDCYRAIKAKKDMFVRSPESIRPYQYVLEPLIIYLNILAYQRKNAKYAGSYNIGPDKKDCLTTKALVEKFFTAYNALSSRTSVGASLASPTRIIYNKKKMRGTKHEAAFLRLDNKLIKKVFGYKEIFSMKDTMTHTAAIYNLMLKFEQKKKIFREHFRDYFLNMISKLY